MGGSGLRVFNADFALFDLPLSGFVSFRDSSVAFTQPSVPAFAAVPGRFWSAQPAIAPRTPGFLPPRQQSPRWLAQLPLRSALAARSAPALGGHKPEIGTGLPGKETKKWSGWSRAVVRRVDVRSRSCQIFSIWVVCGRRVVVTAGTFVFNRGEIWLSNSWSPMCHEHGHEPSLGVVLPKGQRLPVKRLSVVDRSTEAYTLNTS